LLEDIGLGSERDVALAAAAAALTAIWLLTLAAIRIARRPHEPEPGPATLDLGAEPPAVANLLVSDFRVTADAVPATLLDLAARGLVEIERTRPGEYQCRLRGDPKDAATPYEARILELLRKRSSGGVVPAQALTTGPSEESSRWWRKFRLEVIADSHARGLSRDIWDADVLRALGVSTVVPAALVGLAFVSVEAGIGYWLAATALLGTLRSGRRQRDTSAGLDAASRWLGVREKLEQDEVFPTVPPLAVALWERHLAYGAALGVAAGAVRPIPLGAESARRAWSSYGGRWHAVTVSYPKLFPLGWGLHPLGALVRGAAAATVAAGILYAVASVTSSVTVSELEPLELAAVGLLFLVPGVVLLAASLFVAKSAIDLFSSTEVRGEIVRLRPSGPHVAVDDGQSTKIRAWRVRPDLYGRLEQYQVVTASVTRNLRYVRAISTEPAETGLETAIVVPRD